jgi:uncharacterized protein (TIGR03067 family)
VSKVADSAVPAPSRALCDQAEDVRCQTGCPYDNGGSMAPIFIVPFLTCLLACDDAAPSLDGEWAITNEKGEIDRTRNGNYYYSLKIDGKKVSVRVDGELRFKGEIKLNNKIDPKHIDLELVDVHGGGGGTFRGLYKIDGKVLLLKTAKRGEDRPTKLSLDDVLGPPSGRYVKPD